MRRWGWIAFGAVLVSCSPEKYLDTPEKPARTVSMSLQSSTASVAQGGETSVVATVTRVGGGPTPVVTVEDVPSGVAASLVNTDPVDGVFKSTLTLRAASDAKVGQYTIAVRAHADGVVDAVLTIALTVLDAPKLALTLSRPTVTVARGGATPTSLAIGRTTVSAPVTLALEGAAGLTAEFATNPVTGDTVGIVVRAGSQLGAGTYQAVIKASVPGLPDQSVSLTVTVIPDRLQLIGSSPTAVAQGQSATSNVIVNQTDLVGAIALSLDNPIAGISATFPTPSNGVVAMVLAVAPSVAPGAYTVTVRGRANDGTTATTDVVVNVTRASVALAVQPDTVIVFQGTSSTTALSLARTQFAGGVAISAENVPANVTVAAEPANVAGNSTTVRVVAAANAAPATTDVTLRGSLAGFPPAASATTKLTVIVRQAPTGGNVILDWSRCGAPPFVAYQDGDGNWTRADVAGNVARFTIASPKGGFAYADNDGTTDRYMTQAELTAGAIDLCGVRPGTNTVTGTGQHIGFSEFFTYSLGGGSGTSSTGAPNITINNVRDGVHDLVAFGSQLATGRAYIARDIDVPSTASLGVVELAGPNGFAVSRANVNVVGPVSSDGLVQSMSYLTTAACTVNPLYSNSLFGAFSAQTLGFPESVQRPTDYHMLTITASRAGQVRATTLTFHSLTNVTLALQALLTTPALEVVAGPYLRERATFGAIPAGYNSSVSLRYTEGRHVMGVTASIAYAGSSNPVLTMPDLSGVTGWQSAYAYTPGAAGTWSASADGSNGGAPCTEGRTTYNATLSGTLP
jgi:hypothetical protein